MAENDGQSFPETRWSLIRRARVPEADDASLGEWCRGYWLPVREYIRAHGRSREDAEDLTQRFFERMLANGFSRSLPESLTGAFRAFLKRSVKNFLIDQHRAAVRQRRGGGAAHLQVDDMVLADPGPDPETAFARAWMMALIGRASGRLRAEMAAEGKEDFYERVCVLLDGREPEVSRGELAADSGMNDGAFRVALHRTRLRFRAIIEDELRETVSSQEELEEEIRYLLSVWT